MCNWLHHFFPHPFPCEMYGVTTKRNRCVTGVRKTNLDVIRLMKIQLQLRTLLRGVAWSSQAVAVHEETLLNKSGPHDTVVLLQTTLHLGTIHCSIEAQLQSKTLRRHIQHERDFIKAPCRSPANTTHIEWKRMERSLGAGITMWSAPGNIKCSTPVRDLPHCRHLKHAFALYCRYSYNWAPVTGAYVSMETHIEQA